MRTEAAHRARLRRHARYQGEAVCFDSCCSPPLIFCSLIPSFSALTFTIPDREEAGNVARQISCGSCILKGLMSVMESEAVNRAVQVIAD